MSIVYKKPEEVPEVAAFVEAEEILQQFIAGHPEVFQTFRILMEDRNTKRQAADKVVRALGVVCGPWELSSKRTGIKAEALLDALGREKFLAVGGTIETKPVYSVDKKRFEQAVATHQVPAELAKEVVVDTIAYSAPKDVVL